MPCGRQRELYSETHRLRRICSPPTQFDPVAFRCGRPCAHAPAQSEYYMIIIICYYHSHIIILIYYIAPTHLLGANIEESTKFAQGLYHLHQGTSSAAAAPGVFVSSSSSSSSYMPEDAQHVVV